MNSSVKVMTGLLIAMVVIVAAVAGFSMKTQAPAPAAPETASYVPDSQVPSATQNIIVPTDTTVPVLTTVIAAPTEIPQTTAVQPDAPTVPAAPTDAPTAPAAPAAETDADMITAAVSAMAAMKNNTGAFTANKKQSINIQLTDCSVPGAKSIINPIIQKLAGDSDETYSVNGGTATAKSDNSTISFMEAVPPSNANFALDAAGIASVNKSADGANTKYTFVLKPEKTTYSNMKPVYHAMATDYLDLSSIDLGVISITQADINYTGMTIDITLDPSGRVIVYHENMPIEGTGAGKAGIISANATISGSIDETWTITY